jgi:ell wall binding domain 2 (CWB2)
VPRRSLLLAATVALAISGCSLKSDSNSSGPIEKGVKSSNTQAASELGFPVAATRSTTRVSGTDPVADAAGVAAALFPSNAPRSRPAVVALVDKDEWQAAIAGAVLAGDPLHAPLLLSDGGSIPGATSGTLGRLKPKGAALSKGAQVILVGDKPPAPGDFKSGRVHGKDPYSIAAAVDSFQTAITGRPTPNVIVASAEQPGYAMPAAAWAARSGDSVLFVSRNAVPAPTRKAISDHSKPNIYLLGPPTVISTTVEKQLGQLGAVTRIQSKIPGPVANAVAFARSESLWNRRQPGAINSTIASTTRPADAAAAAALGNNGVFAPLLLMDRPNTIPAPLADYFLVLQPGYENNDPTDGLYNHLWILGNKDAVSPAAQAMLDEMAKLVPVDKPPPSRPAPSTTAPTPKKKPQKATPKPKRKTTVKKKP